MPILELDMLIAFTNASDKHHKLADELFLKIREKKLDTKVASSAYLEYELVHKSKEYSEEEIRTDIEMFKNFPNLKEEFLNSQIIVKASELRENSGLTYFDSLHAATALLDDKKIISLDLAYDSIDELIRIDPRKIFSGM